MPECPVTSKHTHDYFTCFLHCLHSTPKQRSLISYPILTMRAMSDMNVVQMMMKCSMKNKLLKDLYMPCCVVALIHKFYNRNI